MKSTSRTRDARSFTKRAYDDRWSVWVYMHPKDAGLPFTVHPCNVMMIPVCIYTSESRSDAESATIGWKPYDGKLTGYRILNLGKQTSAGKG